MSKFLADHLEQLGTFPEFLKCAQITHVSKSDEPQITSNYRPISVLPLFSKVFKNCMITRLASFVNEVSPIPSHRFGFLKKVPTVDAIANFTEYIYDALKEKLHCTSVFIY